MDVAVQPDLTGGHPAAITRSEGCGRRTAGRVEGEKDALSEGMVEDGASGIDERQEPGPLE
jgi:hypothetical protein